MSQDQPREGRRRSASQQRRHSGPDSGPSPADTPTFDELAEYARRFGVSPDQVQHDFVISQVLSAISDESDRFVFFGGTALSRTVLSGLRLSEDIDLMSVGSRREAARALDEAITFGLERRFGEVTAMPWLVDSRRDTDASVFRIGGTNLKIQLIDGTSCPPWPRQQTQIDQRYSSARPVVLTTLTTSAFVAAKTTAWCDSTRNAPRDLYDLWALAQQGHINAEATEVFRRCGPTGGPPRSWMFPPHPPSISEWSDALEQQCIPQVGPEEAYDTVRSAWVAAANQTA